MNIDVLKLVQSAERYATKTARISRHHGPKHWRDVARVGRVICLADPAVDPLIVLLFAAFHDTKRQNDDRDPEHGARAADRLLDLYNEGRLPLDAEQTFKLMYALRVHDARQTSDDPTIGACWDADRLTLSRVGVRPDVRLLSNDVVCANFATFLRIGYNTINAWDGRFDNWPAVVAEFFDQAGT